MKLVKRVKINFSLIFWRKYKIDSFVRPNIVSWSVLFMSVCAIMDSLSGDFCSLQFSFVN